MKKILIIILAASLSGCFFRHKENKDFPSFNFLLKDSITVFNSKQIPGDKPFVLIYFSPDCRECQKETKEILDHMEAFKNVNFYFLTNDPLDRLKVFDKYYSIYNYKNIVLGWDHEFAYIKYFKPTGTPFSILFNRDRKIIAVFSGEVKSEILIAQLKHI